MTAYKRFGEELIGPIGPSGPTGTGFDDLSGTSFQMAYFNTSTELYGTPDAEISGNQIVFSDGTAALPVISFQSNSTTGIYSISNNAIGFSTNAGEKVSIWDADSGDYINGINIGETSLIGGIQRLSANPSNSWQDGNCGNSSTLVFTPSDFTNVDVRSGPRSWGSYARTSTFGGYMEGVAGANGNSIVAIKLLPKGFRVPQSLVDNVIVSSSDISGPTWDAGTIELFTQDINTPNSVPFSLGSITTMVNWTVGRNIEYATDTGPSAVGNGSIVVIIEIIIPTGDQIILTDSLVGVQVPIERI